MKRNLIPKGLQLLRGKLQSFDYMVNQLKKCCDKYPKCGHTKECKRLFDAKCHLMAPAIGGNKKATPAKAIEQNTSGRGN